MRTYFVNKKWKIRLLFVLFFLFFNFHLPTFTGFAEENYDDTALEEEILQQIDKLDLEALQSYISSLNGLEDSTVAERLMAYIKGADLQYLSLGKAFAKVFLAKIDGLLPAFACITAVALLSGLLSALKSGTAGQTASEMIFIITYVAALIPMIAVLTEVFTVSLASIHSMQKQMHIVFPIMLTLMGASGSMVSVSVCRPAVAFFSTTIVSIIDSVVFPLTITIVVFSMASKLTKDLKIGKFTAFFKSINKWIIGICVSVFGIVFTLQGITTAVYDGVVRRAAKYAIGNGIPIVGGFLSGGFDLAVAGGILIKNSLGGMSIFLMLSVLFEPIAILISVNVLLRLVSAITQPFGEGKISDFLGETAENLHYCTAGLLFMAFLYFLTIMIMIFSTEALL
jgi:stage III sporulation protein AE